MNIDTHHAVALFVVANLFLCVAAGATIFGDDSEYWADPRTKFRILILRVVSINFDVAAISVLLTGHWMLTIIFVVHSVIVGAIGASLHPCMTWRELQSGFRSVSAQAESASLPLEMKYALVDRACTHLTMLAFVDAIAYPLWAGWKWYTTVPLAFVAPPLVGGILRFAFGSIRRIGLMAHQPR